MRDDPVGLDVSDCDREPIHIPVSIQPHGMMIVFDAGTLGATHAAGDVEGRLGFDSWPGRPASDLFGAELDATFRDLGDAGPVGLGPVTSVGGEMFDVVAFRTGGSIVVELEPALPAETRASVVLEDLAAAGIALERTAGLRSLCERAAVEFRRLTGYDRVMIYRFLDDDAGVVVAEDRTPGLDGFLNHHFPASDIPKQARALYVRNRIRVIPDVTYRPVPLRAADPAAEPVDLSDSALRSVSPIHVQYLKNMGVAASASISIVKDGVLWGLIACHNLSPRVISYDTRVVCRTLAGGLARQVKAKEEADSYRERLRLRAMEDEATARLGRSPSIREALAAALPDLQRTLGSDGAAVLIGRDVLTSGTCPPEADIRRLATWAAPQAASQTFSTDMLPALYPPADPFAEAASGLLAITASTEEPLVVLWFRAEQIRVVEWAGNPHKAVKMGPGETLSPRASFEAWSETVRGQSRAWTLPEIESGTRLRQILMDARSQKRLRELNEKLAETVADKELLLGRQELLVKEVNHRVQNSLMLVASFLRLQSRAANDDALRRNLDDAQRRIGAVALVHRRLYRADQVETIDLSRYLDELCAETISSLGPEWADQVSVDLAPISIDTDRAVPLGLVLTELVINANKYAYGGAPGPIEITLEQERRNFRLIVADRGRGKVEIGKGFGSRMMGAMVSQIAGEIEYGDNRPGLRAILTAPIHAAGRTGT